MTKKYKFICVILLFTFITPHIVVSNEDQYDIPEYIHIPKWICIGANPPSLIPDLFYESGIKFCIKCNKDGTPYQDDSLMLFQDVNKKSLYPVDSMRHHFHAIYPDMKEGDIFPLPGAVYCYHKIKRDMDAFRLDKDKLPDNIAPKKSNYFFPL